MEEKKAKITAKCREANAQMRVFPINNLKTTNYKVRYPVISEKIETLLANLIILYDELFDKIADKDGDEMKAEQERCRQQEDEIKDFLSNLEDCYYELEAEEASKGEASVSAADKTKLELLYEAIKKQLKNSKRREEQEKRARKEKEKITKERIEANFRVESEGLKKKAELISSLATKIPLGTWKNVEDTKVPNP